MTPTTNQPGTPAAPSEPWRILGSQKAFIITFCLSAIITALALTYVFSEKYEASTTIYYRPSEITRLKSTDTQALGSPVPAPPFKVIGRTIEDVVASESVLRPVVTGLRLDREQKTYEGPWYQVIYQKTRNTLLELAQNAWTILKYGRLVEQDPTTLALNRLRDSIRIENKDSYVFRVSVRDKFPERSARIVDTLTGVLVGWLREEERKPGEQKRAQLEQLISGKSGEIEDYRKQIELLVTRNRISSIELETQKGVERLSELKLVEVQLESQLEERRTRLASLSDKLRFKSQIDSGMAVSNAERIQPEDLKKLSSDKVFTEVDLNGLTARQGALADSISSLDQRLQTLPALQNKLDIIKTRLQAAERDFIQLADAYQEAIVQSAAASSEIKILDHAVVPATPVAPIKIYHVALAGILGLLLSIGLVFFLSFLNIRIFFKSLGVQGRRQPYPSTGGPSEPSESREQRSER